MKRWRYIMVILCIGFCNHLYSQHKATVRMHFDFDKYELTSRGKALLDSLLHLPAISGHKLELFGHTDAIGDNSYNDKLSDRRVNTARSYLVKHGFPKANILIDSGFGKRMPLNNNADKIQRMLNRRVEIVITEPVPSLAKTIADTAFHAGSNIILKNLNFIGNRHQLMPESWPIMLDLLDVMRKFPRLEIEIQGHVCCTGGKEGYDDDSRALILSTNRAVYVYRYLIDNGIAAKRLSWKAFGNSKPLFPQEDTQEKRMRNRRVEIKVVKK